jgi:HK97 family phage prohead protease
MNNQHDKSSLARVAWLEKQGCAFRDFASFEVRAADPAADGGEGAGLYVEGVATPFNTPTTRFSSNGIDYREQIDRNAFDDADMSDVIFNYNHGGKVVARTRNNTLQISVQSDGLHMRARLDGTEEGRKLHEEIKGGYIDRMSFAFTTPEDGSNTTFENGAYMRTVMKVKKVYDVSAVDIPVYDTTSISTRNAFSVEIEKEEKAAVAARLRREILQEEITLTTQIYGGNHDE